MRKHAFIILPLILVLTALLTAIPFTNASYPSTINKAGVGWSTAFTEADIDFISSHFDLYSLSFIDNSEAQQLHAHNADLILLGYRDCILTKDSWEQDDWEEIILHSDWFMREEDGDSIWSPSFAGVYLMNFSNPEWQQHYIDYVNSEMDDFDGAWVDDVWYYPEWYLSGFNGTVPEAQVTNWVANMTSFVQHMTSEINGLVVINSDDLWGDTYIQYADGQVMEFFMHGDAPSNQWNDYINLGDDFQRKSSLGKPVWCASIMQPQGNSSDSNCVSVCYNSFVENNSALADTYWSMNNWQSTDESKGYYAIMDTDLGLPTPTPTPTATPAAAPYVPPSTSLGEGSAFDSLIGLCAVLAVFAIIIWPFLPEDRKPF